jgi:hypothetical protein
MTGGDRGIPKDWDALSDREPDRVREPSDLGAPGPHPPLLTSMASAWADLVVLLAVCTGALVGVLLMGERPTLAAFGWALVLALSWWVFAAAVLVVVRHGTPGMLLAGIRFDRAVSNDRVFWVMVAALVGVATLGLSAVAGGYAVLRLAAGRGLTWVVVEA